MTTTTHATQTIAFLLWVDKPTKDAILQNIASHYDISIEEAYDEITDDEAESLLDYLTGNIRTAASVLMQKFNYQS